VSAVRHLVPLWLRRTWRAYVGTAVTVAVCFGVCFFALAGARRTQSAIPRFFASVNASTLTVTSCQGYDPAIAAQIAALPGVVSSASYFGVVAYPLVDGRPAFEQAFETQATTDGRYFVQDRFTPTDGRMADPTRVDEVMVNEFAATRFGYRVGQQFDLGVWGLEQFTDPSFFASPSPPVDHLVVTIVGVGVFPEEVLQDDADRTGRLQLTPALSERWASSANYGAQGLVLSGGDAATGAVVSRVKELAPVCSAEFRFTSVDIDNALTASRSLSVVIGAFGLITALGGMVLAAQALGRSVRRTREAFDVLVSIGASRGQVVVLAAASSGVAAAVGSLGAVVLAVAASPLMPVGPVRRVEPEPGVDVDLTVLGFGALAVTLALVAWGVWLVSRGASTRRARPSALHGALIGLPPPVSIGTRFALANRPGSPARATVLGGVVAVVMLTSVATFAQSLDRLVHRPAAFGWDFDAAVVLGNGYDNFDAAPVAGVLDGDAGVARWTSVWFGAGTSAGVDLPLLGWEPDSAIQPVLLSGRMVRDTGEIVLGTASANALHVSIGDTIVLEGGDQPEQLQVVGLAALPTIGRTHAQHTSLGRGGIVVPAAAPGADIDIFGERQEGLGPNAVFVELGATGDVERLRDEMAPLGGFAGIDTIGVQRPAEIVSTGDVRRAPGLLSIVLAIAAGISLLVALGASVRLHRRDLAVLGSLGLTRRQTARAILVQASVVVGCALVLGVPIGFALGRAMWSNFVGRLGVDAGAELPVRVWLAIVVAGTAIALVAAVRPARDARRLQVAALLRQA
jgi:hypothetical protein